MKITGQIAKHLREVHFGGNWTAVNLKETVADLSWQQATKKVYSFNTIATLVFHINYYIDVTLKVLEGGPLNAKDEYSFCHPPISSAEDWDRLRNKMWAEAEAFAARIEQLADEKLFDDLTDPKYGSYYRNLQGIVEHTHYHLGQIVLIKKIIQAGGRASAAGSSE